VDLIRDLLDKKVVDRNGREMGRVDSIVLVLENGAPRVIAIELGPAVLARRIHPILGQWIEGVEHAFGFEAGRPVRIPLDHVRDFKDPVRVDLTFGETGAATVEHALRRWIRAIPGS